MYSMQQLASIGAGFNGTAGNDVAEDPSLPVKHFGD